MTKSQNIKFESVDTIDIFTPNFGAYKYQADEIKTVTTSYGQENKELTGNAGAVIGMIKRNPSTKIKYTAGVFSTGMMSDEFGTELQNGNTDIVFTDVVSLLSNVATLSYKPVDDEILAVYINGKSYDVIVKTASETPVVGVSVVFTKPTGDTKGTITFAANEYTDGSDVAIKYRRIIKADSLERSHDKVSEDIAMVITGTWSDDCGVVRKYQAIAPRVAPTGTFDIVIGENQADQTFEGTIMKAKCAANVSAMKWIWYDGDAADVEG